MKNISIVVSGLLGTLCLASQGCAMQTPSWVPLRASLSAKVDATLVWVGRGECERLENGTWVRKPEFDYEFSVEQRRSGKHWESVKSMRRRHPGYDGSAGGRLQTLYFQLDFDVSVSAPGVDASIKSSLGAGRGVTDREFRKATLEIKADVSRFAPFDRYRITQSYNYEAGQLVEDVELNDGDKPWVRNHEVATLFAANKFDQAPTTLQ